MDEQPLLDKLPPPLEASPSRQSEPPLPDGPPPPPPKASRATTFTPPLPEASWSTTSTPPPRYQTPPGLRQDASLSSAAGPSSQKTAREGEEDDHTRLHIRDNTDARHGANDFGDQTQSGMWGVHPSRRRNQTLPVINPSPSRERTASFREWFRSIQGDFLPDGVIQLRIAVCGFALYGILSLVSNTRDLLKKLKVNVKYQILVFLLIGAIWAITAITVAVTMSARTPFGRICSHHGTRLGFFGIIMLFLLNIGLMVPHNSWSTPIIWILVCLTAIGLLASWVLSCVWGEVDDKLAQRP